MLCSTCGKDKGSNPVECTECCEFNNSCRLLCQPIEVHEADTQDNIIANQKAGFLQASFFVKDLSMDELFLFVKRMEAIAAGAAIAYNQRSIKERVPDLQGAQKAKSFKKAVSDQKLEQLPKKERVLLTDEQKAIKVLLDIGVPLEVATAQVQKRMAEAGRVAPRV